MIAFQLQSSETVCESQIARSCPRIGAEQFIERPSTRSAVRSREAVEVLPNGCVRQVDSTYAEPAVFELPDFEQLIVDGARLSGALAERRADLSQLVSNANLALGAVGRQREALARAIELLPDFMRQANTTFVNLRSTLTDLNPPVDASIPVAERLGPFFAEFRAAAADAVPTITDLSEIVRQPGPDNDLVELTRAQVPLAAAGVGSGAPDCGSDPTSDFEAAADDDFSQGGLGEAACALRNGLPQLATLRAYTPELVGWFDDFSKSGLVDASGGLGRVGTSFNAFTISGSGLPDLLSPIDPADVLSGSGSDSLDIGNHARCPGSNERDPGDGSAPFTDGGQVNCDPSQVPTGP